MHAISKQQDQQLFFRFRLDFFHFSVFTAAATPYGLQARAASHAMHMLLHVRVKGSGHACFLHRSSLGSP